ncbi:MAG: 16S rRNA (adenine(1518)-N(6)/adenine(1519)-N(6))-dimethyltransferase RsmA [Treponema sp.]|nr:16S rRNA (adenine(1518)-N(6)/adenine(1519)-N(6))-dimethyltransferase RsmA [Treponema sp.]
MELNYNSAAELKSFLEQNSMGMQKKFGQNFLINPGIRQALVDELEAEAGSQVWEIGPGLGAMTRLLRERDILVRAFEIDHGFARALEELFAGDTGLALIKGDVMKTWPSEPSAPYLLGNLPYNIAAALLADFIEKGRLFQRMVVTVQREIAQRMAARPNSPAYSSFSVLCASVYTVKPLMIIRGASFYPKPNVDSQGVRLDLRTDIGPDSYPAAFYPLLRRLFASRRKMIKNNLANFIASGAGGLGLLSAGPLPATPQEIAAGVLAHSGLSGNERAENLELESFVRLAQAIEDMRK